MTGTWLTKALAQKRRSLFVESHRRLAVFAPMALSETPVLGRGCRRVP